LGGSDDGLDRDLALPGEVRGECATGCEGMQKLAIWAIDRRQQRDIMSLKFGMLLVHYPLFYLRIPPGSNQEPSSSALD